MGCGKPTEWTSSQPLTEIALSRGAQVFGKMAAKVDTRASGSLIKGNQLFFFKFPPGAGRAGACVANTRCRGSTAPASPLCDEQSSIHVMNSSAQHNERKHADDTELSGIAVAPSGYPLLFNVSPISRPCLRPEQGKLSVVFDIRFDEPKLMENEPPYPLFVALLPLTPPPRPSPTLEQIVVYDVKKWLKRPETQFLVRRAVDSEFTPAITKAIVPDREWLYVLVVPESPGRLVKLFFAVPHDDLRGHSSMVDVRTIALGKIHYGPLGLSLPTAGVTPT